MSRQPMRGFSLVEVLVSLVIIAVGLLGIAKIQTLAYAETGTAAARSIVAIQASSMAASMRANRSFWAAARAVNPFTFTITGTAISSNDTTVPASADCTLVTGSQAPCTPVNLAVYDVQQWATALNGVLGANGAVNATINCASATPTLPVNCTIVVGWTERVIGPSGTPGSAVTQSYTLYVRP